MRVTLLSVPAAARHKGANAGRSSASGEQNGKMSRLRRTLTRAAMGTGSPVPMAKRKEVLMSQRESGYLRKPRDQSRIGSRWRAWTSWVRHRRRVSTRSLPPPYALAQEFIECALRFDTTRIVAMLLRKDFDHAASRVLCSLTVRFAKKVVLTKRIRWFEGSNGSPSFNHCWMIWDRQHRGPPTLAYASHN